MICAKGHPTTEREPGQHLLPCGCVLETATDEAIRKEFGPGADVDRIRAGSYPVTRYPA